MVPDTSLMSVRERLDDVSSRTMLVYEGVCVVFFFLMLTIALVQIANRLIPIDHPWELRWTVAWSVRMMLFTAFLGIGLVHYHREDIEIHALKEWVKDRSRPSVGTAYQFVIDVAVLVILGVLTYASFTFGVESLDVSPAPTFFSWFKQGHLVLGMAVGLGVAFLARLVRTVTDLWRFLVPVVGPAIDAVRE
jgi:TRAP-type C4-dicarboxylate transport system permease small subunit